MRRRRLTGGVAGAVAVLAALSGLTACGPADVPVVALAYTGGKPTAVLVNCPTFKINQMYVSDTTTESSKATWSVKGPEDSEPAQITLLEAPPGWTVTEQTLTAFDQHGKYAAQPFSSRGHSGTTVAFTVDQLKALKPGEVLINKGHYEPVTISEKKFRQDAKDAC